MRTLPVPAWVKAAVDIWLIAADVTTGPVFRATNKGQRIGNTAFSPKVIRGVVKSGYPKCRFEKHSASGPGSHVCPSVSWSRR